MDYIYQSDFTYFPTSLEQIAAARYNRDKYAEITLDLADDFKYTKYVFNMFNTYTYNVWENFDNSYCHKVAEWHCRTSMTNSHKQHYLLIANGNVIYCRESLPTADEINSIYTTFMEWNGASAPGYVGGFPFRIYTLKYVPCAEETGDEEADEEEYYADESQQVDEKPTLEWDEDVPPLPQNSPVLRRSARLAKKNPRRSQRLSGIERVDYTGME